MSSAKAVQEEPIEITINDSSSHINEYENLDSVLYDGRRWNLSERNIDSSVSISQFSMATTNTADASSSLFETQSSADRLSVLSPLMSAGQAEDDPRRPRQFSGGYYGSTLINEKHANFVLMYDMLTGIRIAVNFDDYDVVYCS